MLMLLEALAPRSALGATAQRRPPPPPRRNDRRRGARNETAFSPPKPPAPMQTSEPRPWWAGRGVQALYGLSSAAAMGVSYSRNRSVPWALVHGLVGVPYLVYAGAEWARDR